MKNNILAMAMAQIQNAGKSRRFLVVFRDCSSTLEKVLKCLKDNGYIKNVVKFTEGNKNILVVLLKYYSTNPNAKMYIAEPVIEDFYTANKAAILNNRTKILAPRAPTQYEHAIKDINNKSKGSCIIFSSYKDFHKYRDQSNSFGILIVSTNKGIMSHVQAIQEKAGGKVLLGVY